MTVFDAHDEELYLIGLRRFLCIDAESGKAMEQAPVKSLGNEVNGSRALEEQVNEKSAKADDIGLSKADRIRLACDYLGLDGTAVLQQINGEDFDLEECDSKCLGAAAPWLENRLKVPLDWIASGEPELLRADSHIGLLVGEAAIAARERLYGLTLSWLAAALEEDEGELGGILERMVFDDPDMALLARKAGGRWVLAAGGLLFEPWQETFKHRS